jgi:hypothetical protein
MSVFAEYTTRAGTSPIIPYGRQALPATNRATRWHRREHVWPFSRPQTGQITVQQLSWPTRAVRLGGLATCTLGAVRIFVGSGRPQLVWVSKTIGLPPPAR